MSLLRLAYTSVLLWTSCASALSPTVEERYCSEPAQVQRNPDGKIARSRAVLAFFRARHPCPVTGKITGACAGWAVDHIVPLECGGCDSVNNMQWLPNAIKSAPGVLAKDRWEQKVYCP